MTGLRISFRAMALPLGAAVAALAAQPGPGPRFLLLSETWISLAGGGQSGTYTEHAYDGDGRRVRTGISIGLDGSGGLFEKREFSYHSDGLLQAEVNFRGDELESRVLHRYDASRRLAERLVEAGDGAERFRDVYAYDGQGRVLVETRLKGGSPASMHRFAYAADGSLSSDSLFEPDGPDLLPVQASLHAPGRVPGEQRESRWRKQDGAWYHVMDTFRLHADGRLVASAAYPVGGPRQDSSAFAYDADGNRLLDERFDGAGRPLSRLVLRWQDTQPVAIRRRADREGGAARGPILLLGGPAGHGWNHLGLDLLGRPRHQAFTARGRPE